jgi:NAD(P)-dependent dehydrogenase (short-subunit alcohol dehydrogenase family)
METVEPRDQERSMSSNGSHAGKVWFVTGAASGFGRAMGQEVLDRGDRVVATDHDVEALDVFAERDPGDALVRHLDVTDSAAARRVVDEAVAHFGRVDVVVNNAGFGYVGAVEELTEDELREQLEVNLFGVINVTRAALPHLRRQRRGHLLQMSSLNGVEGLVGGAYYAASKFGIEGFSESLADEVDHLGIRVTIVEPGPHRTRFLSAGSVKWSETEIDDYAESVGEVREQLRGLHGQQPGDPARAVRAMIQAVESADPPRRLPLGEVALDHIRTRLTAQLAQLESWAQLGATSDFPVTA